jgi:hypothetical protein
VVEMFLSEKLTLAVLIMTSIFVVISAERGLEIFFLMILIGVMVIREMIEMFASSELKVKMNLFVYIGVIVFLYIILERVIMILIDVLIR